MLKKKFWKWIIKKINNFLNKVNGIFNYWVKFI